MSELVVLEIVDGGYYLAAELTPPKKQKRLIALRTWIEKSGEDGSTYRLADFLTPAVKAKRTMSFELADPEPATAAAPKPKALKAK
jgi:hypothetical protein